MQRLMRRKNEPSIEPCSDGFSVPSGLLSFLTKMQTDVANGCVVPDAPLGGFLICFGQQLGQQLIVT